MKIWVRTAAVMATVGLVAVSTAGPVGAQGQTEIRFETTGAVAAYLHAQGIQLGPLPTNTDHSLGWSGEGVFTIQGAGSCRIIANGAVVSEAPGPVANCRWP